ncbi:hypothetical protein AC249_AIPGENE29056 [Exaiptasia diaphana]|nr:hypothetical protein AC249_AIPGENE29056 [Exaiptasia diaphana]
MYFFSGVIDDGLETYHIEPHSTFEDTGAHKIQLASNAKRENMQCGKNLFMFTSLLLQKPLHRDFNVQRKSLGFRYFCVLRAELATNQPMTERVYKKLRFLGRRKEKSKTMKQQQLQLQNEEFAMQRFSL